MDARVCSTREIWQLIFQKDIRSCVNSRIASQLSIRVLDIVRHINNYTTIARSLELLLRNIWKIFIDRVERVRYVAVRDK